MKRGRSGPIGSRMTIATLAAALLFVELVLVLRDFRRTRAPLSGGAA